MTNDDRIAALEARINALQESQDKVSQQLADAKQDQWQGRIDALELQAHLGAMEADDKVAARMEQLRGKWSEVRAQVSQASSTAGDVKDTLWSGLENAARDVRQALMDSKKKMTS